MATEEFVIKEHNGISYGYFPNFEAQGILTACSCRMGGESAVVPGTLNLALHVGDEAKLVLENRRRFAEALGIKAEAFTTCAQVHGSKVQLITPALVGAGALQVADTIAATDALVTNLPEVPLLLFYADCTPVLIADPVKRVIGLAHAGWRGTVAEIVKQTIKVMQESFGCEPEAMLGAIGPCIGACCYEVDDFVRDKALQYTEFFAPVPGKQGKYMLDLQGLNAKQLRDCGLKQENISLAKTCTNDNNSRFCSYRAEQGKTGRMGVVLMLR